MILSLLAGAAWPSASAAAIEREQGQPVHLADVDDFAFESFDAEYRLGRDADGRSTLRTVERITALFPEYDQNRGFIRDLTRVYDGHDTELEVLSVTDETGAPRPFTTEANGDFVSVVMAVPQGEFVHGRQSYVLEYAQRDVTRFFDDVSLDEFYWDVNGTGWVQPFGSVSARLILDDGLAEAFNGSAACYRGAFGSTEPCDIAAEGGGLAASAEDLGPGENVTIAAGFLPGTFSGPPVPFLERVPLLLYGGLASLLAALALLGLTLLRGLRGAKTGRAVIAQYEPPEGVSAALAAEIVRAQKKAMTATLLDLAVRRKMRLLHDGPSDLYGAQPLESTGLLPIEQSLYERLFRSSDTAVWFTPTSTRLGDAAALLRSQARTEALRAGLIRKPGARMLAVIIPLFLLALGLPVLHAVITGNFVLMTVLLAVGINVLVWVLIGTAAALLMLRPRTAEGALLHDHLMGLREYIRLAEADRLRMLQSASGAEVDAQRVVQVYERLLPYAVIFGFEREWQAELAKYYRETAPDWAAGSSASFSQGLSIAAFGSAVAASRPTPSASSGSGSGSGSSFSSSSGGSTGGGFSGGGGGGGGGRGI